MKKIWQATFETRHFEFEAYDFTESDAIDACLRAWEIHCGKRGTDLDLVTREDIETHSFKIGSGYCELMEVK
jgi:hypothetical protein